MDVSKFAYVHLHGFLGSAQSRLGILLRERLKPRGIDVQLLDLTGGQGYRAASISLGLKELGKFYQVSQKPLKVMGNSMGGYIAALYASNHPSHVNQLVMYNPAFNLEDNWASIIAYNFPDKPAEEVLKQWETDGELAFPPKSDREEIVVGYPYLVDSLRYPSYPLVDVPTKVFAGMQDKVIPILTQDAWLSRQQIQDNIELIKLDDDHHFSQDSSIETILKHLVKYFC